MPVLDKLFLVEYEPETKWWNRYGPYSTEEERNRAGLEMRAQGRIVAGVDAIDTFYFRKILTDEERRY